MDDMNNGAPQDDAVKNENEDQQAAPMTDAPEGEAPEGEKPADGAEEGGEEKHEEEPAA